MFAKSCILSLDPGKFRGVGGGGGQFIGACAIQAGFVLYKFCPVE
jgi:hypothetical protein